MTTLSIESIAEEFNPRGVYLNSATVGLPPRRSIDAFASATSDWAQGICTPDLYDEAVERSRSAFASLVGVPVDWVATGSLVSPFIGLVAAALPDGARVLCAENEFTSVLFPFLAHSDRGVSVTSVPLEELIDRIDSSFDLVAVSHVQSADGRVCDLASLSSACRRHGVASLVDATQSAGWHPIDGTSVDYLVVGAYKWLMSPRGTSLMSVNPAAKFTLRPLYANWYAGTNPWESIYGEPLRLAQTARKYDTSPAWLNWMATAPALELCVELGVEQIFQHNCSLATEAANRLGASVSGTAIVVIPTSHPADQIVARLNDNQIAAAIRDGAVRVSFHLYNSISDVEALVAALRE